MALSGAAPLSPPPAQTVRGEWRTVAASVEGAGHLARGEACQDAHRVVVDGERLVVAVADGAGSASRAADGARLAVDAAVTALLASCGHAGPGSGAAIAVALGQARVALEAEARVRGCSLGDLATTLHLAVVSGDHVLTGQIGDGAVVARCGPELVVLDPVLRGEYLNETVFVTSGAWVDEARLGTHALADVDALAVMTDGLQLLAFDVAAGRPHPGFFMPLWSWADDAPDAADAELAAFLASGRVRARTDDDVTLVLAVRS